MIDRSRRALRHRGSPLGFGKKAEISTDTATGFPGLRHTRQLLARTGRILFFFIVTPNDSPRFRRHTDRRLSSKTDPPLVVDPDTVLSGPVSR